MEVLRSSGLKNISVSIPTDYPNVEFSLLFTDSLNATAFNLSASSDGNGVVNVLLPAVYKKYDAEFEVVLTDDNDEDLVSHEVSLYRPYCEPATASAKLGISLESAIEYERVARFIIESKTGGFKRYRKTIQTVGLGLDYLPVRERITKIYSFYENNELVDPNTYTISPDQTSIVLIDSEDYVNKDEFKPVWFTRWNSLDFPENWDYLIDADCGWQTIPSAIQEACLLLIQDISCGNNKYLNKYIAQYRTDGYDIKYAPAAYGSTGNAIVDKILATYPTYQAQFGMRVL